MPTGLTKKPDAATSALANGMFTAETNVEAAGIRQDLGSLRLARERAFGRLSGSCTSASIARLDHEIDKLEVMSI